MLIIKNTCFMFPISIFATLGLLLGCFLIMPGIGMRKQIENNVIRRFFDKESDRRQPMVQKLLYDYSPIMNGVNDATEKDVRALFYRGGGEAALGGLAAVIKRKVMKGFLARLKELKKSVGGASIR